MSAVGFGSSADAALDPASLDGVPLRTRRVRTAGVELRLVEAGPDDGPLVLLLHGFPEFWYGWRRQIPALVEAGFRVWAPDQRGYARSDKPERISAYRLDRLRDDAVALLDLAGAERAAVVGHDWGAAVAWWTAITRPERVARLAILNVPHPLAAMEVMRRSPEQLRRSWYIGVFQLPLLPEWALSARGFAGLERALLATSRPGAFTDDDLTRYRAAWSEPGALRGMIDWYRAMLRRPPRSARGERSAGDGRRGGRVRVPTLLLWGVQDAFLTRATADRSAELCDDVRTVLFEEAGHFVQHEEPERVNRELIGFLEGPHA